jgi:triacylglycerol lipase
MQRQTIVLVHGVLGFGNPLNLPLFANYFNGVATHFRRAGHDVVTPQVNPIGSIPQRGEQLAAAIRRLGQPVHVIAHSMGGLDARHAITHVFGAPEPVRTLITIGTPHFGSPVADAIANPTDPLFAHIPAVLLLQLQRNAGALHDLTTAAAKEFDETTHDVPGVTYINVAGDASQGSHELLLFHLAAVIGRLKGETNDGVVTKSSALHPRHKHLNHDWPVDHAGEVGWSLDSPVPVEIELPFLPTSAHLQRFEALLPLIEPSA